MSSVNTLANGITVVMENMSYLKSASFGVWVRVGSANEDDSNNGIAHMIEHMMFKGTNSRSAKQIADEMARRREEINRQIFDGISEEERKVFWSVSSRINENMKKIPF